jgi:N-acetylglucosamine kinase-like BadF-type ATPase
VYQAGLDLPEELATAAHELADWTERAPLLAENDLFALLRAGTAAKDAVAVVCGTGINAIGVRADGRTARFPALGEVSGDWGGGAGIGSAALWHAIRAEDGRGPATSLCGVVAGAFGAGSVREVVEALHFARLPPEALNALAPLLFAEAEAGDPVAGAVVDRQAEEIVIMADVLLRRLALQDAAVPVVLGGSVLAAQDPRLVAGVVGGLAERAPAARAVWVAEPPVVGAALLALEAAGAAPDALVTAAHEVVATIEDRAWRS